MLNQSNTQRQNEYLQAKPEEMEAVINTALDSGYRHIDTAFNYNNEESIGNSLKKWFDKGGKREDLFITTKVCLFCFSFR